METQQKFQLANNPPKELDFKDVPDKELKACCYWEYARESVTISDLVAVTNKEWTAPSDKNYAKAFRYMHELAEYHPFQPFLLIDGRGQTQFPKPWESLGQDRKRYSATNKWHGHLKLSPTWIFDRAPTGVAFDFSTELKNTFELNRSHPNHFKDALEQYCASKLQQAQGIGVFMILWKNVTNTEIKDAFESWLINNRPPQYPEPQLKGHKLEDYRDALKYLSFMRAFAHHTWRNPQFPKALKERVREDEKQAMRQRTEALDKFKKFFLSLPKDELPLSWKTFAQRKHCLG